MEKDDTIATLLPESVTKDGKLTIGTNPSYAPAEFLDADGKTQIGYDMDLARAMGNIFGLDTEIVSSNFDTIIPAIGSKYDLGIAAFTITKERMESVDFVSYFTAGMGYAVAAGNPKNVDENDLCGLNVAVETGTVEEEAINKTAKQCKADGKKDITHPVLQAADRRHHRCGDRQGRRLLRRFPGCRLRHRPDRWSAGTARQGLR